MYDPRTDPKSIAAKHYYLFKVLRMLYNIHKHFQLYWYPVRDLIVDKKTIGFWGRHKDKIQITFKDADDGFQSDAVCDLGYTYSFIYCNNDIPDSKNYLCATSQRFIWILRRLKKEWNHVYMCNTS